MKREMLKDFVGWGSLLWLIGYLLGFVFFFIMPASIMGWVIMPIGVVITVWVLLTKIKNHPFMYYFQMAIVWALLAIMLDYLFIVKMLKPADGYYKPDVYLYYVLTFLLPIIIYWWRSKKK